MVLRAAFTDASLSALFRFLYVLFVFASCLFIFFFFFQAEDGIRDWSVTGVQTCALPILSLTVVGSNAPANWPVAQAGTVIVPAATNNFDQFVIVLMENHDLSDIYGPAPYMTQLADQYSFSQHWASITNPSQPNYIALIGGSTFGVSGDGNHPNLNHPTIVDIIENSGHTWN